MTKLIPDRTTMVRPTSRARWYRIDDDWTTKRQATLSVPWAGPANFEESVSYKDEIHDVDEIISTISKASKRTYSTSTANTARASRT